MPDDFLDFLVDAFRINRQELVPGDKHLNMEDLRHLPNPNNAVRPIRKPQPMKLTCLDERESIFRYVEKKTCCCTTRTTLSSTSSISCTKPYTNPPCAKSW